ncbi:hypothetical protein EC973_000998 [Apophysomyces ossiformis]|uniref:Uncharacterized protein n=1 Tax=Apophysomyces ossiformis TaxID=679940 RepID=A0A8H7C0A4_9FUNG|nr:hypothetical protein EC973_000998 [Apophysomyces ossiformis]
MFDFVPEVNYSARSSLKRKLSQYQSSLLQRHPVRLANGQIGSSTDSFPDWRTTTAVMEEMVFDRSSLLETSLPFQIHDPLVYDIDATTNQGVVATGKHRKCNVQWQGKRSDHRILFWRYPSWQPMGQLDLTFVPSEVLCQIIAIQSIRMPQQKEKVRLFAVAVGQPLAPYNGDINVDLWRAVFVYRLFDDGSTSCLGHLQTNGSFISQDVFFFSDASWGRSNDDKPGTNNETGHVKEWLRVTCPEFADFESDYTVFMFAFGPMYQDINGYGQFARFDLRSYPGTVDPSISPVIQNPAGRYEYLNYKLWQQARLPNPGKPAELISVVRLGSKVSCMMHFRDPPHLNHLICVGSYTRDELYIYDWRFGIVSGIIPWLSPQVARQEEGSEPHQSWQSVRPWGLETAMVLPPLIPELELPTNHLAQRGFRLIAVAYDGCDKLATKVWDISYLLDNVWNPMDQEGEYDDTRHEPDYTHRFRWWKRGSRKLQQLAIRMIQAEETEEFLDTNSSETVSQLSMLDKLPCSPPETAKCLILTHKYDTVDPRNGNMPMKLAAYNLLQTSLILLTEEGKLIVLDIETGRVIGRTENVAAMASPKTKSAMKVRAIDVNVLRGREIVITSREGVLRSVDSR